MKNMTEEEEAEAKRKFGPSVSHKCKAETNLSKHIEDSLDAKDLKSAPVRADGRDAGDAFIVDGFLTKKECKALIAASEKEGYDELGWKETYRSNTRLVVHDESLASSLKDRLRQFLPKEIKINKETWKFVGLNECFRFCKYVDGQFFKKHCDGNFVRNSGEASTFTINIYLNGHPDFKAGKTRFYLSQDPEKVTDAVSPKPGLLLAFNHSIRDLLHDGETVKEGTKYLLRSDAMYRRVHSQKTKQTRP